MSSGETKTNTTLIIVGVIVGGLLCLVSLVIGFIFLRTPAAKPVQAGLIGGPCLANGTCTAPNSICKFNACYEQCKGRNAFPCETDGDIPYIKTYWCNYSGCPAWRPPPEEKEEEKRPDWFQTMAEQQHQTDMAKAQQQLEAQKYEQARKEEADKEAAADKADQKIQCACVGACRVGRENEDGDDGQPWCFVKGGTRCKTAIASLNEHTSSKAWVPCTGI